MAQFSHRKYISGREKCLEKKLRKRKKESPIEMVKKSFFWIYIFVYTWIYIPLLLIALNVLCSWISCASSMKFVFFFSKPKLYVSCLTHSVPSCFWRFISNVRIVWFLLVLYTASCIRLLYVSICMYCFVTKKEPNNSSGNTSK